MANAPAKPILGKSDRDFSTPNVRQTPKMENSFRSFCSGATGINTPCSMMRTNSYSRFMQKTTGVSLYDKTYGFSNSPSRHSRIIKNKPTKRRSLEVTRLSNLNHREQYQRLIEQYRTTTLKETSKLFGLSSKTSFSNIRVEKVNDTIIDLTGKISPINVDKKSIILKEKSQYLENITQRNKANAKQEKNKENGEINGSSVDPKIYSPEIKIPKGFSSPYLSENFFPDLIKTYNRRERQRLAQRSSDEARARLFREKREAKDALLAEILQEKLKLKDKKIPDISELPELTCDMNERINESLTPYLPQQNLSQCFNISITREHMSTLFGLNWLNDEIINFYMELVVARSKERDDLPSVHTMNTFFYPRLSSQAYSSVRRWTKKVDIFSKDIILYPIHLGVHWCLAVVDFIKKEIRYYDSMGGANRQCLLTLKNYLESEHENKKGSAIDLSDWQLLSMLDIPQQMNGSDCGVFSCKFAEYICANSDLSFNQSDMPYFRRAMVWEILNQKLLR